MALAAILFATFAFAQPAAAQDSSGGAEAPAPTETKASDTSEPAEAPAADEAEAPSEAGESPDSSASPETAPASEPASASEGTEANDKPSSEPPAEPPADAVKMEEEPEPKPEATGPSAADQGTSTPETTPATETGCGASASADAETGASGDSGSADATCGDVQTTTTPAAPPATPREEPTPPTASTTPAPQTEVAAAPEASTPSIVLVVEVPAEAQPDAPAPEPDSGPQPPVAVISVEATEATPDGLDEALGGAEVSLGAPDPLIGLVLAGGSPVRARLIAVGGKGVVRKLVSCARPGARVPLSLTCTRLRAAVALGLRAELWPSSRTPTTNALTEAGRVAARAQTRRAPRTAKGERIAPTIEHAEPANHRSKGPWASGGSSGGSSTGSGTLRIFALTSAALLPFVRPRALRARIRASLVPVGELGVSLPERPG